MGGQPIRHGISEKHIITSLFVIAIVVPVSFFFFYNNHDKEKLNIEKDVKVKQQEELSQRAPKEKTVVNFNNECIYKDVRNLTPPEAEYVLKSAKNKIVKILSEKDVGFLTYWVVLHAKPMTNAELEVLGNDFLMTVRDNTGDGRNWGLKMQVYWNEKIAYTCINSNYGGESQFYNSFWDDGERAKTGLGEPPKSLDETGLYGSFCQEPIFTWCKVIGYNQKTKVLTLETKDRCMIELIFNTFSGLGKETRGCMFDRMPELKKVRIIYKNSEDNEIGSAFYDIEYWCRMAQTEVVPITIYDQETNEWMDIHLRFKSKLLNEQEYNEKYKAMNEYYAQIKSEYYQKAWMELFPLVEGFTLNADLPIEHEDFKW